MARTKQEDHIDRLRAQWSRELPEVDTTPMAVLGRVYRLYRLVSPTIQEGFKAFGINRREFDVLAALCRSGPPYRLTPTQLYAELLVPSGSLTHRLGRLQKAGLVVRRPSEQDGRSIAVELSPEGHRRVVDAFRADMANELRFIGGLHPADLTKLAALLRKLNLAAEAELLAERK